MKDAAADTATFAQLWQGGFAHLAFSQPQTGTVPEIPLPEYMTHQTMRGPEVQTRRPGSHTSGPVRTGLRAPGSREKGHEEAEKLRPPCAQQTYIGSILVSVNPYRMFGIYGQEQVQQYSGRALGENPP